MTIIGSGNVATSFAKEFHKNGIYINQILSKNINNAKKLAEKINAKPIDDFLDLEQVDIFIIAVTDDNISSVSAKIPFKKSLIVHTSGTTSINSLKNKRKGVFYPLQTFLKNKEINFSKIPFCLEFNNENDKEILTYLANIFSKNIFYINSNQRKYIHISAVFVCNFVNHLYSIGENICNENNISFEILKPLIEETQKKIILNSPKNSQTGPAKRNDIQTIKEHLKLIENRTYKKIYSLITKSIQNEYNNN